MKMCVVAAVVTALGTATLGSCNPATPKFAFTHAERRGRLVDKELGPDREILVVLGDRPHLERAFREAGIAARLVEPVYK